MSASEIPASWDAIAPVTLRPYQLLCLVCREGEQLCAAGGKAAEIELRHDEFWRRKDAFLRGVRERIAREPDVPVALRCNAGDVYAWQDPGLADDSPEGPDYNRKRDLDILRRLDLAPGSVLPARTLLWRLHRTTPTVRGVCGYDTVTADAWRGCPKAASGYYERGHELGVDALAPIPGEAERAAEKERSLAAMYAAEAITVRPHLLLCAVCQYGSGIRPPLDADNLPEMIQLILKKPQTRIRLVRGADWMMCAPCKRRVARLNACVNVHGSGGLSNELRDVTLLQILGLTCGATLPARELFALLFERMPTTVAVCTKDNPHPSVWWDTCGDKAAGSASYVKGREELLRSPLFGEGG